MKSSSGGPWSIVTRMRLLPLGPYNVPFSSTSAAGAVGVGIAANVSIADVVAVAAVAAAVTDVVDFDDGVHVVDDDLILFNFEQLNFKLHLHFKEFTLHSLFIGSLANGHLLQHFVEWATFDDD